tara:strand:- start:723 stop:1256 length:534 start_codon:yes stop_codon:yes gene_type:complete
MLGADEVATVKMAEATLVDGTEVYTEGELEVGAILFVRAGEGVSEDPFAPAGKHETNDGQIITVGENGEISEIQNSDADSVEEEVEVELEEDVKIEEEIKTDMNAEDLVEAIAEMLIPQTEVIEELRKELSTLKERFEVVANTPAANKVTTNTFKEILDDKNSKMEAKLNMLRKLRN